VQPPGHAWAWMWCRTLSSQRASRVAARPFLSSLGGGPEFSADLTGIMNRIVISPFLVQVWSRAYGRYQPAQPRLYLHVEPAVARSTASEPLFGKASVICR
jgi:hypothetical protein